MKIKRIFFSDYNIAVIVEGLSEESSMKIKRTDKQLKSRSEGEDALNLIDMDYVKSRLEIDESADAYHVCVNIPGVKREDIQISVKGHEVTICINPSVFIGRCQTDGADEKAFCVSRRFSLPVKIDLVHARAHYDRDVLNLTLPKFLGNSTPIDIV